MEERKELKQDPDDRDQEGNKNIQWHPGFFAGMELEFGGYPVTLEREHELTRGSLSIDLLIIRKLTDQIIDNDIGNIFRRHNIIEYKSPDDELSIDVYYKVQGYACLYKMSGETVNSIPAQDITVTLYRDTFPRKMIALLKESGSTITQAFPGVYYVEGNCLFPTQIIVSSELRPEAHAGLRIMSRRAQAEDIRIFASQARAFQTQADKDRADSIFEISSRANRAIYEKLYKEDANMCATLMDIMKEDIDRKVQHGAEQEKLSNIREFMKSMNMSSTAVMDALKIPPEQQARYAELL